jgi:hypothetical protein
MFSFSSINKKAFGILEKPSNAAGIFTTLMHNPGSFESMTDSTQPHNPETSVLPKGNALPRYMLMEVSYSSYTTGHMLDPANHKLGLACAAPC